MDVDPLGCHTENWRSTAEGGAVHGRENDCSEVADNESAAEVQEANNSRDELAEDDPVDT